ncbi:MAG: hypothetical protein AAF996_13250 [Pseudomonadota bacterium]
MSSSLKTLAVSCAAFGALAPLAPNAQASEVNFCEAGTDGCLKAWVENRSSALVKAVNITEQNGDDSCDGGLKKTQERNMVGGAGAAEGAEFAFYAKTICKYKVKFKTTSGCTGDKVQHLTPSDFDDGYFVVKLDNACGTLNAKKSKRRSEYDPES